MTNLPAQIRLATATGEYHKALRDAGMIDVVADSLAIYWNKAMVRMMVKQQLKDGIRFDGSRMDDDETDVVIGDVTFEAYTEDADGNMELVAKPGWCKED